MGAGEVPVAVIRAMLNHKEESLNKNTCKKAMERRSDIDGAYG